jgi:hypothetical protein
LHLFSWHMVAQGYATDASQAVHLKHSQRANVLFHNSPCSTAAKLETAQCMFLRSAHAWYDPAHHTVNVVLCLSLNKCPRQNA